MRIRIAFAITLFAVSSLSASVAAQGFDVQKFRPAHSPNALFSQEGADTVGHLEPMGGAILDFSSAPLIRATEDDQTATLVEQQLALHLMAGMGITEYAEIGVELPLYLVNDGATSTGTDIEGSEIGDLRLRAKGRFLSSLDGGLGLGAALDLTAPTGAPAVFVGSDGFTVAPRAIVDYRIGQLLVAANLGVNLRPSARLENLSIGNELIYGAGAELAFMRGLLYLTGELYGTTPIDDLFAENQSPMEGLIGAKVASDYNFHVTIAMGGGLVPGEGSTEFRSLVGIQYAPRTLDYDNDGYENRNDGCPTEPEDRDGFEDSDGCPDPDNDLDGVPDEADACPAEPEDRDDFEDDDGCPDPDNDQDGVPDEADQCPIDQPEDIDGFRDEDGCPDTDNDEDGIADVADACPDEAEDPDGFEDDDGCPEPDNDRDGILDADDLCPQEPGLAREQGCPPAEQKAVLEKGSITILDKVFFETGKATIKPESFDLLDQVALILRSTPQVEKVEVAGHTDDRGREEANLELSQSRAEAVRDYLVKEGIDAGRLQAKGYGESSPIAKGRSRDARAQNRRVEFTILEQPETSEAPNEEAGDPAETDTKAEPDPEGGEAGQEDAPE